MFLILFSGGLCGSKYDNGKNGFLSMLSIVILVGVDCNIPRMVHYMRLVMLLIAITIIDDVM